MASAVVEEVKVAAEAAVGWMEDVAAVTRVKVVTTVAMMVALV